MHPILFEIGPIKIFTYGFLLALAFLSAIFVAAGKPSAWACRRKNFTTSVSISSWRPWWAPACSTSCWICALPGPPAENLRPVGRGPGLPRRGHPGPPGGRLLYPPPRSALARHPGRPGPGDARGAIFRAHRLFYGRVLLRQAQPTCPGPWSSPTPTPSVPCRGRCIPPSFTRPFWPWGSSGCSIGSEDPQALRRPVILLLIFSWPAWCALWWSFSGAPWITGARCFSGWMPLTQLIALGLFLVSGGLLLWFGRRAASEPAPGKVN